MRRQPGQGFTLVELLVVIALVGLVSAITIPVFFTQQERNKQATCIEQLRTIGVALTEYYQDNGCYPAAPRRDFLQTQENAQWIPFSSWTGVTNATYMPTSGSNGANDLTAAPMGARFIDNTGQLAYVHYIVKISQVGNPSTGIADQFTWSATGYDFSWNQTLSWPLTTVAQSITAARAVTLGNTDASNNPILATNHAPYPQVQITFAAANGHYQGDTWSFWAGPGTLPSSGSTTRPEPLWDEWRHPSDRIAMVVQQSLPAGTTSVQIHLKDAVKFTPGMFVVVSDQVDMGNPCQTLSEMAEVQGVDNSTDPATLYFYRPLTNSYQVTPDSSNPNYPQYISVDCGLAVPHSCVTKLTAAASRGATSVQISLYDLPKFPIGGAMTGPIVVLRNPVTHAMEMAIIRNGGFVVDPVDPSKIDISFLQPLKHDYVYNPTAAPPQISTIDNEDEMLAYPGLTPAQVSLYSQNLITGNLGLETLYQLYLNDSNDYLRHYTMFHCPAMQQTQSIDRTRYLKTLAAGVENDSGASPVWQSNDAAQWRTVDPLWAGYNTYDLTYNYNQFDGAILSFDDIVGHGDLNSCRQLQNSQAPADTVVCWCYGHQFHTKNPQAVYLQDYAGMPGYPAQVINEVFDLTQQETDEGKSQQQVVSEDLQKFNADLPQAVQNSERLRQNELTLTLWADGSVGVTRPQVLLFQNPLQNTVTNSAGHTELQLADGNWIPPFLRSPGDGQR